MVMTPSLRRGLAACLFVSLAACGGDDPTPLQPGDATDDTSTDATQPGDEDASPDAADEDTTPDVVVPDTEEPDAGDDVSDTDTGEELPEGFFIPGLSAATNVYFDAQGILHADCATDNDCAAVLGYFHARDRFLQMDIRRRLTTGRLTQATGPLGTDIAESYRTIFTTPDGDPLEERLAAAMPDDVRSYFEAYANGVNAWLDDLAAGRNDAKLPAETRFALVDFTEIPRWTVEDSFATILALVESLTNSSGAIIRRGRVWSEIADEALITDLYSPRTPVLAPTQGDFSFDGGVRKGLPLALAPAHLPLLRRASNALAQADARLSAAGLFRDEPVGTIGSNIWAVNGSRSASGNALFSNDPHLTLSNPAIWYIAHLDSKTNGEGTLHTGGVTFAGLPFVILGQNEHISWGATTTYFDMTDVYIETLSEDGEGVIFNGDTVPFVVREWTYEFPDGTSETRTARYVPHHGPVLSIDEENGTAVSMRWTGNSILEDGWFLMDVMRATSVDEAREGFRKVTTIGQNWTVADTEGNIGWFPYNTIPYRPWASAELPTSIPLPGDGSAEWDGFFDYDDIPQLLNPEAGFIANANNDMTGALYDGDPYNDGHPPLQVDAAPGYRQQRILQVLENTDEPTREGMLELVGDTHSLVGELVVPFLLDAADGAELSDHQQRVVDALTAWDFTCPTGLASSDPDGPTDPDPTAAAASIGCFAFHVTFGRAWLASFDDDWEALDRISYPSSEVFVDLLLRPESFTNPTETYWDDQSTEDVVETRDDILLRALEQAGTWLADELGEDTDAWRWGRAHTLTMPADLFDQLGVSNYNNGPHATPGGLGTVNVAAPRSYSDNNYAHASGASMRFVCELFEDGPDCTIQLPGGQVHHRDDPNYDDLLDRWLENEPTPFVFDVDAVAADPTVRTLTVDPAE